MLKLIYSLSDKEITLKFNKKRSFWTRELTTILAFSIFVHLLCFTLFNIKSLKPLQEVVLMPGAAQSEIETLISSPKKLRVDEYGFIQKIPSLPKTSSTLSNVVASISHPLTLGDDKIQVKHSDPFYDIENKGLISPPKVHLYRVVQPMRVEIAGGLRDRYQEIRAKPKKILLGTTETLHLKFRVEVEDRSGKIFNTEMLSSSGSSKYDQYALNILKNMQFEKRENQFITHGEIDLFIEADSRDIYD